MEAKHLLRQAPEDCDELETIGENHRDDQVDDAIAEMKRKRKWQEHEKE
jgi:hypothetical protein